MASSNESDGDALREEIETEIADHLAAAVERFQQEGLAPPEAQRRAGERFGEIEAVRRRLWWIHEGEAIMWRTLGIGLLVVVFAGLAIATYGGWRMQRSMDDRLAQLTEQLDALNRTQRELLDREKPSATLEIDGRAYLGEPSKPAAGATVQICRFPEKTEEGVLAVRSLTTDAQGVFRSRPLPPGDYYVLAKLMHPADLAVSRPHYVQSRPLYLYAGLARPETVELDVQFHYGTLVLEASRSLPFLVRTQAKDVPANQADRYMAAPILNLRLTSFDLAIPWTPARAEPAYWPIVGVRRAGIPSDRAWDAFTEGFTEQRMLAAGRYRLFALIMPKHVDRFARTPVPRDDKELAEIVLEGRVDDRVFSGSRGVPGLDGATEKEFEIQDGKVTRVRVEIPEDYQAKIQSMIDADPQWYSMDSDKPRSQYISPLPLELTVLED